MPQKPLSNSEKYIASQTMAVARINLKNIDYFKFKKLVIDGNRDDYGSCSKEVQALCDCVQTLKFRDEEFDDESDRMRFAEICIYYKQILNSKRIESLDMRIKSGWWGDHKNAYSAGKIKPAALKELLISKTKAWITRHSPSQLTVATVAEKIDGAGLYVFKHKEHQCFQFVGRADKIFSRVGEKLRASFEGGLTEPLAALLMIAMQSDWDFYFMPVSKDDDERVLRVMENDLILKHDCIWPHGLNFRLHIDSLLEVSEFRKSCLRHSWPPEAEVEDNDINLAKLRKQIEQQDEGINPEIPPEIVETPKKTKRISKEERPPWEGVIETPPSPTTNGKKEVKGEAFVIPAFDPEPFERPDSPKSDHSSSTFVVAPTKAIPPSEHTSSPATTPTPGRKSPMKHVAKPTSRPTTPAKKAPRSSGIKPLQGQIPKKKQVSIPRSDGIDRVASTTSLISNTEHGTPRTRHRVREKDTNAPATPKKGWQKDQKGNTTPLEKKEDDVDSLGKSSPSQSLSPSQSVSSDCTRSAESIERPPSSKSFSSFSESKENELECKKKATTAVKKSHSFSCRSPRTSRPSSARSAIKNKTTEVTKSQSKLPRASSAGSEGRISPNI